MAPYEARSATAGPVLLLLATLVLGLTTAASPLAQAHIGGEVVRPVFLTPAPSMITLDGPFTISWSDPDTDPTGVLHFYLMPNANVPPAAEPEAALLGGTEIASVAVSDTVDSLVWDPTGTAPGVYTLYALTTDPPLCDQVTPLHATFVIPDPDPSVAPPLSALWRKPGDPLTTISGLYPLRLSVKSVAQPTFTLELGTMTAQLDGPVGTDCATHVAFEVTRSLVTNAMATPDTEGGANLWSAKYVWDDFDGLPAGNYLIRATVTTEAGETLTLFTPGELQLLPATAVDADGEVAGPEVAADTAGDAAGDVAGMEPADGGGGSADGCGAGGSDPSQGAPLSLLCLLVLGLWASTKRRRWAVR